MNTNCIKLVSFKLAYCYGTLNRVCAIVMLTFFTWLSLSLRLDLIRLGLWFGLDLD